MPKPQKKDSNRELAARRAQVKLLEGKPISNQEKADIAWIERSEAAFYADLWAHKCSKADYCRLAGRQNKVIDDAARLYGFPIGGAEINLYDAVKALHDFVAANGAKLRSRVTDEDDREELEKEKLRKQIEGLDLDNESKEIDLQHARGDAIPRDQLRLSLTALQAHLRSFGQQLRRDQPELIDSWNQFLERLSTEVASGKLCFE